jgi:mRNA-degrading endonuclease RelE of RelBE toxin-antitoxin system
MKLTLRRAADKQLKRLSVENKERVGLALRKLAKNPPEGDIQPYRRRKDVFRAKAWRLPHIFQQRTPR